MAQKARDNYNKEEINNGLIIMEAYFSERATI